MTLKSFHLVFIACASALAFLFGAWALNNPAFAGTGRLVGGFGAFTIGLALIVYEAWFLRYSKRS